MKQIRYILFLIPVLAFFACEEPIDLKLKGMDQYYFVEGYMTTDSVNQYVYLKKTKNYMTNNTFESETAADVKILEEESGTLCNVFALHFNTTTGRYETDSMIKGVPGRIYKLQVMINGFEITASDTMRTPVPIDSLHLFETRDTFAMFGGDTSFFYRLHVAVNFQDPLVTGDNYFFDTYWNGIKKTDTLIDKAYMSDYYANGIYFPDIVVTQSSFFENPGDNSYSVKDGDVIMIEGANVNSKYMEYFGNIMQGYMSDGLPFMGPPSNPVGNILLNGNKKNGFGYFATRAVYRSSIVFDKTKVILLN